MEKSSICKKSPTTGKATEKVLAHNDRRDCLHDQPWALVAPTCVRIHFRSLFPHCEYEKHISEAYSPPGFFIICGSRASKGVLKLAFLTHLNDGVKVVTIERSKILDNVQKFRQEISLALQIDDDSLRDKTGKSLKKPVPFGHRPRWQIYSSDGSRRYHNIDLLISMSAENPTGTSLLYTGGVFFWPGVKVGHERFVSGIQGFADSGSKQLRLKTLSLRPLIFEIHDFITMQECDHLISKARRHLGDSVVSKMDGDEGKVTQLGGQAKPISCRGAIPRL